MIAGLQVQEALKLLHGLPVSAGEALVWNGVANNFYKTAFQRRDDCLSHETYPEPIPLSLSTVRATADDLFAAGATHFEGNRLLTLALDRDLVVGLECPAGHQRRVMKPQHLVAAREAKCPACGEDARPRLEHAIAAGSPLAGEKLASLGIPPYDIVRLTDGEREHVFLMEGDRP
jgi:adenylyltransferase/sulfurtransferase